MDSGPRPGRCDDVIEFMEAFAAGAILTMLADDRIPNTFRGGDKLPGSLSRPASRLLGCSPSTQDHRREKGLRCLFGISSSLAAAHRHQKNGFGCWTAPRTAILSRSAAPRCTLLTAGL